jgi:hypothetical protein
VARVDHRPAGVEQPFAELQREHDRLEREIVKAERVYERALRHRRSSGLEAAGARLMGLIGRQRALKQEMGRR